MSKLDILTLRNIAVKRISRKVYNNIADAEDTVHNAIVNLLKANTDMNLLCKKASYQAIDDFRARAKYNRKKKSYVKVVPFQECAKQIENVSAQKSYQELTDDDLLDFQMSYGLSESEIKVASMLLSHTPSEISEALGISIYTVRTHIYNSRKKISVLNTSRKTA